MINSWGSQVTALSDLMKSFDLGQINDVVNVTTSPINLHDVEVSFEHIVGELKEMEIGIVSIISLQEGLTDLPKVEGDLPLINLSSDDLRPHRSIIERELETLIAVISKFDLIIKERKIWFEPWQPLLTLIQMTQDGIPIDLTRIAEVIRCPQDQAENLLKLLLEENPLIGKYDATKKVYTKGTNISQYLESMLEKISSFGD